MPRRTKIITTLGPATDEPVKMQALIEAGADLVRINLSHGNIADHKKRIKLATDCAQSLNKIIGILVDLQGPKIRIAGFKNKSVSLKEGELFVLDAALASDQGTEKAVGLDYKSLPQEVFPGDKLLLDDGRIVLKVENIDGTKINCIVEVQGELSSNKGLNKLGGGLSAPSLTDKDKQDIKLIGDLPVDYVALSFPKSAKDVNQARELIAQTGSKAQIVAKIERQEAVDNIDEIIEAADAVMVARGDLGVEIGYAELPGVQKYIISRAGLSDKAVITATQMMESMIKNPIPTRAEVSDVANAILDGTDAVMLSAETATGDFPSKVVKILDEVSKATESQRLAKTSRHRLETLFDRDDEAIAMAAMYIANHLKIKAIVALTESGSTPLWMSRIRSEIPIYALSRHRSTCSKMTLFKGVHPVQFDATAHSSWQVTSQALDELIRKGILEPNDKVILTKGNVIGVGGKANSLRILTAELIDKS